MSFEESNKTIHSVESQWHYEEMIAGGFEPETKEQIGFVRCYRYKKGDHTIDVSTGASADYWKDITTGKGGYWASLKPHINSLK